MGYCKTWTDHSDLHNFTLQVAQNAVDESQLAFMQLFNAPTFLHGVLSWTAEKMVKKGITAPMGDEFQAYIGLKLVASLNRVSEASSY